MIDCLPAPCLYMCVWGEGKREAFRNPFGGLRSAACGSAACATRRNSLLLTESLALAAGAALPATAAYCCYRCVVIVITVDRGG